jgi:N-acetylglutamate synthase-like GNAT family acetyltransferase
VTRAAIRDATPADATAISELVCHVAGETIFNDGPEDGRRYFVAMNTPAATAGKLHDSAYRYHVAERDGRMVGMVAMRGNSHVYHLFVDASMHGSGLGRALWERAREDCRQHGNSGRYTVDATPSTVGFYEKLGFLVSGTLGVRNGHPAVPMKLEPQYRS